VDVFGATNPEGDEIWIFTFFWLKKKSPAASNVLIGLDGFGACIFKRVRVSTEPVGPGSEAVAGRQAVLVELAVWLVDG